jgi:hypothetical protein
LSVIVSPKKSPQNCKTKGVNMTPAALVSYYPLMTRCCNLTVI